MDDDDYHLASRYRWYLNSDGYAATSVYRPKRQIRLHRLILGEPSGLTVDHINGDKLDNRKSNLRACTNRENNLNRPIQRNNSCGFKGVYRDVRSGKYMAQIKRDKKRYRYGPYATPQAAYAKYCEAAEQLHGTYANVSNAAIGG